MSQHWTWRNYPKDGSRYLSPLGRAAEDKSLHCHCGKSAFYLIPGVGKLAGTFIGFCEEHKDDASDLGRRNGNIARAKEQK